MSELKHGAQYHLTQIAATPGLVLWMFNWLVIVLYMLYRLAISVDTTQTIVVSTAPDPSSSSITNIQLAAAVMVALLAWYAIGFGVHYFLGKLANHFENPLKTYQVLTIGGTLLGTLLFAVGIYMLSENLGVSIAVLGAGVVGLISFGLQQFLAKIWRIELV